MEYTTTAFHASQSLIEDKSLKRFIGLILIKSGNSCNELSETEILEISATGLIISLSWDYATITNEKTNETVHSTSNKEEVKEFIYNYFK